MQQNIQQHRVIVIGATTRERVPPDARQVAAP